MNSGLLPIASKNVCRQVKSEYKINQRCDKNVVLSLQKLSNKYKNDCNGKVVKGFIQSLNLTPLSVSLYTEKDVEFYHQMVQRFPLLVDATCGIVSKVNTARVFYYSFIFYDREIKTEPVPFLEILTDKPNERNLSISQ